MYILILNNEIVGSSDTPVGLPLGFSSIEYPESSLDTLYYSDGEVRVKPNKPNPEAYWDNQSNRWATLEPVRLPHPNPLTQHNLAAAIYNHIKLLDEPLADVIALLLALQQGDSAEIAIRRTRLTEQFDK
ncbi:MAG: hypothetical protein KME59_21565 [Trichormus sp. ATA11-4-KO1]|jgi:hypothetical protein|nr:hypothetical protein [Trichormus sp. ATA11-4-KO1]